VANVNRGSERPPWSERSELARGEQPRQLGVDAGGVAGGGAEGRRGGEGTLGVLGLGEVVAVQGDGERVDQAARRPLPAAQPALLVTRSRAATAGSMPMPGGKPERVESRPHSPPHGHTS